MTPLDRMKERLVDALFQATDRDGKTDIELLSGIHRAPPEQAFLVISGGHKSRVEFGVYFDADKLAESVLADAREILREEIDPTSANWRDGFATSEAENCFEARQRIAELEAENHDLAEELDNLRSALRDRWSSVLPKDGGGE